jgi:hypothetical protein
MKHKHQTFIRMNSGIIHRMEQPSHHRHCWLQKPAAHYLSTDIILELLCYLLQEVMETEDEMIER